MESRTWSSPFTIARGNIVEIELLADPQRLSELNVAMVDGPSRTDIYGTRNVIRMDTSIGRMATCDPTLYDQQCAKKEPRFLMSVVEVLNHCDEFCEVRTRDRSVFGVLVYLYANWFLVRPRTGADTAEVVVDAYDITSVTSLGYPRL